MAEQAEVAWLADQLRRYTYRPGWVMRILPPMSAHPLFDGPRLEVRYEAPDSRNPGRTIPLVNSTMIPRYETDNADGFARWLAHALFEIELHESREWLRRDGAIYDDPHGR